LNCSSSFFLLHLVSSSSLRSRKERGKARLAKSARLQNMCHSESYVTIQEPTHERRVETRACTQRTAATAHPRRSSGNQKLPEHAQWQARPAYADGRHEPGVHQVSRRFAAQNSVISRIDHIVRESSKSKKVAPGVFHSGGHQSASSNY